MAEATQNDQGGDPDYTLEETIAQLDGWTRGKPMYPVEVAYSAVHWLAELAATVKGAVLVEVSGVIANLRAWLDDDTPHIPELTCLEMHRWLRVALSEKRFAARTEKSK